MFKHSKKGFTTVELILVIAAIAILAAVLIPTFSNLVNSSQAIKEAATALQGDLVVAQGEYANIPTTDAANYEGTMNDGVYTYTTQNGKYVCTFSTATNAWEITKK